MKKAVTTKKKPILSAWVVEVYRGVAITTPNGRTFSPRFPFSARGGYSVEEVRESVDEILALKGLTTWEGK